MKGLKGAPSKAAKKEFNAKKSRSKPPFYGVLERDSKFD
jgi:hypothetical protein